MGGLDSGISSATNSIYLESAFFKPEIIRGKARRYGLQTDASMRFERGVDFQLQSYAIERASQLIMNVMDCNFAPIQTFEKNTCDALHSDKRHHPFMSNQR